MSVPVVCAYCGVEDPETRDHVPPRSLFAPPRPSDLITVPCCESCREGTSLDDEYFRNELLMRHDVAGREDVSAILEAVLRSYKKPEKRGFREDLLKRTRRRDLYTPGGLFLGQVGTYETDLARHSRVVNRIVRGLYLHESEEPLPAGAYVKSWALEGFTDSLTKEGEEQLIRFMEIAMRGPGQVIGPGTFAYRRVFGEEEHVSLWFLVFFETVHFLAFTTAHPPQSAASTAEA